MPELTLTDFVDVVSKVGTPKPPKLNSLKTDQPTIHHMIYFNLSEII